MNKKRYTCKNEKRRYQNRVVAGANIQVNCSDADSDHNVDYEPKPIVTKVPRHVNEGSFG